MRAGTLTSAALTEACLARIAAHDTAIHAFVTVTSARARADAARADSDLAAGRVHGPMHGIPYALKDVYATAGIATTCCSRLLAGSVPADDSAVAARLHAGGGVLLGKTATHEFAIGGPSLDLPWPPARNPWNLDHVPGGSSSGSAAAVAAGFTRVAMGSDTAGSIRGPAFFCGLVGCKPTFGRVPVAGVYPLAPTLDHCGTLTASVEDAALVLSVVAGFDARTRMPGPGDGDLAGLRIGYPRALFAGAANVSAELVAALDGAVARAARLGARVVPVDLPPFEGIDACGRTILHAEAFALHAATLRAAPERYGRFAYQLLAAGAGLTVRDYLRAGRARAALTATLDDIFAGCDAILTASALAEPLRFDAVGPDAPVALASQSVTFNLSGHPTLSIPLGRFSSGLPLGAQLAGAPFAEPLLLRIGAALAVPLLEAADAPAARLASGTRPA